MYTAESINKWVERMAVRGGWRPLSGLICEIVNSVGQGKVREFQTPMAVATMNTHFCESFVRKESCRPVTTFELAVIQ